MSADTSRPEPMDTAGSGPAPDKSASRPTGMKAGKSRFGCAFILGFAVLATGIGGAAGWLTGRHSFSPTSGAEPTDNAIPARPETAKTVSTPSDLVVIEARLNAVEALVEEQDQRIRAFERLTWNIASQNDRIIALETARAAPVKQTRTASGANLAALETRLEALENASSANLSSDVLGQINALKIQLGALSTDVPDERDDPGDTQSATNLVRRALAFSELAEAAAHSRPFVMEYAMLGEVWPDAPGLEPLMMLASQGVPTRSALTRSFPGRAMREATGYRRRWLGVIEVRAINRNNDAVQQIEDLLIAGDLAGAVRKTEALDTDAARTWLDHARKRLTLEATVSELREILALQAGEER